MGIRYVLAPQAAIDLVEIWRFIKEQSSLVIADRVETAIREKFAFLAQTPGAGHRRKDLTYVALHDRVLAEQLEMFQEWIRAFARRRLQA